MLVSSSKVRGKEKIFVKSRYLIVTESKLRKKKKKREVIRIWQRDSEPTVRAPDGQIWNDLNTKIK